MCYVEFTMILAQDQIHSWSLRILNFKVKVLRHLNRNLIFYILFVQLMRHRNLVHLSTLFSKDGQEQKHPSSQRT